MSYEPGPERLRGSLDVLDSCLAMFDVAYLKHLSQAAGHAEYVRVVGDAELIRLIDIAEPYDIILGRPHLEAEVEDDTAFWLSRINTIRSEQPYGTPYDYLIARRSDPSQFYVRETEHDEPKAYGPEPSREIIRYLYRAEILDLGSSDLV